MIIFNLSLNVSSYSLLYITNLCFLLFSSDNIADLLCINLETPYGSLL